MRASAGWMTVLAASWGCSFNGQKGGAASDAPVGHVDADPLAPDADPAAPDARPDAGAQCVSLSVTPANFDECDVPDPGDADLVITQMAKIDTGTGILTYGPDEVSLPGVGLVTQAGGPSIRIISARSITIPAGVTLKVVGPYALALVATGSALGTITIAGTLDARADGTTNGPGYYAAACGAGMNGVADTDSNNNDGTSGGGGGSYGDAHPGGYSGAVADSNGNFADPGTPGGAVSLLPLRGGCPGGAGGIGGPLGGGAGGALDLVANVSVAVTGAGRASVSGGGGAPGTASGDGGGGGGSGGALLVEAPLLTLADGDLTSNGGGGGEGECVGGDPAQAGERGALAGNTRANGGSSGDGADGGYGATTSDATDGGELGSGQSNDACGGGGGGGGAGRIHLPAGLITSGGFGISPAAE